MTRPEGMSVAQKRLGIQKFQDTPCLSCGAPRSVINGKWLATERKLAGLTLREMARRLEYSAAYICDVEHNSRHCSPKIRQAYEALR